LVVYIYFFQAMNKLEEEKQEEIEQSQKENTIDNEHILEEGEQEEPSISPLRGKLTLYLIRFTIYIFSLILCFNITRFFVFILFYKKPHDIILLTTVETIAQVYSIVCSIPPIIISITGIIGLLYIDKIPYRSIQELLLVGVWNFFILLKIFLNQKLISFTSLWCSLALFFAAICLISFAFIKISPLEIINVVAVPVVFAISDIAILSFLIIILMIVVFFKYSYDYKVAQGFRELVQTDEEYLTFEDKLYRRIEKVFMNLGVLEPINPSTSTITNQPSTILNDEDEDDDKIESNSVLNQQEEEQPKEVQKEEEKVENVVKNE